ncbi:MAG: sn-glycerol-3-phosphate ABC transporter ATP-binding protein UgpC [Phycisphaeraceae bacterium]|nr:sn-glycerol-3-phosphate ABC transporter ATP-binding protein UgpC [Phycisphaeraceae bacterium]
MAEVHFENVVKVYPGNVLAVSDLNLTIENAEFIVLVGPSGCGKSTTLRMVAGLEDITEGVIRIGDRVVNDVPPKDRDIAMVFQNYALYPHMTVYKNMAFGLKLRGMPRVEIDQRVQWAAEILGLKELLQRKPRALSGGQRQRVAVGRAIVRQPAAFLFDEPLSNLDAKLRVETRAELKRLHRRLATTTIYVTHDQEEAMTLGDRVVVMSDGLVQQCDTPLNIYNAPKNRFVAGFLGTPPMNFFEGKLRRDGGESYFEGGGIRLRLPKAHIQSVEEAGSASQGVEVALGIRPEGLSLRPLDGREAQPGQSFSMVANVIEPLGSAMDVYCDTQDGNRLVARVRAEPLEPDQQITLHVDMTKVHLFEPGTYGRNLTLPAIESGTLDPVGAA